MADLVPATGNKKGHLAAAVNQYSSVRQQIVAQTREQVLKNSLTLQWKGVGVPRLWHTSPEVGRSGQMIPFDNGHPVKVVG